MGEIKCIFVEIASLSLYPGNVLYVLIKFF